MQCFGAWYAHVPGLKVVMPYDAMSAKALLKAAIRDPNPVVFLEHECLYGHMFHTNGGDFFAKHRRFRRYCFAAWQGPGFERGRGCYVGFFLSRMIYALEAHEALKEQGFMPKSLICAPFAPLIWKRCSLLCVKQIVWSPLRWDGLRGGVGAGIAARVNEHAFFDLDAPPVRVTGEDIPMPYASNLEKLALPSTQKVIDAVKQVC